MGAEERTLVEKFVDLAKLWIGPPLNLVLIHPHADVVTSHPIIDLDDCYDIDPSLEVTDPIHQIALNICGLSGHLSSRHIGFLWDNVWRATRYSLTHIGARLILDILDIEVPLLLDALYTGMSTSINDILSGDLAFFNSMRGVIRASLLVIPLRIPDPAIQQIKNQLSSVENASWAFEKRELPQVLLTPKPLADNSRYKIWTMMHRRLVLIMREAMTVDTENLSSIRDTNQSSNAEGLKDRVYLDKEIILENLPQVIAMGIQSTLDLILAARDQ